MGEFLFNLDVEKGYHFNMQLKKKNDNFYYIKSFSNFYMERNTKKKKKKAKHNTEIGKKIFVMCITDTRLISLTIKNS